MAGDAIAAIEHLRTRAGIDSSRVVVIGFSWGGNAALRLSSAGFRGARAKPAAVVGFYPVCTPFLGALPDAAERMNNLRADADIGRPVSIELIPDAEHVFDAHDPRATREAEQRLMDFLRRHAPPRT